MAAKLLSKITVVIVNAKTVVVSTSLTIWGTQNVEKRIIKDPSCQSQRKRKGIHKSKYKALKQ